MDADPVSLWLCESNEEGGREMIFTRAALIASGILALASLGRPAAGEAEECTGKHSPEEKHSSATGFRYGFRVDPMDFVENGTSLQAALVRSMVFGRPTPGDKGQIEAHFAEVLSKQKPDGSLEDKHRQGVLAALRSACALEQPQLVCGSRLAYKSCAAGYWQCSF